MNRFGAVRRKADRPKFKEGWLADLDGSAVTKFYRIMRLSLFNLFKPASVVASSASDRPIWDEQHADRLIGATVLIGLTRVHPDGVQSQDQMFGVIRSANSRDGFEILLSGTRAGETYWLPPDPLKLVTAPSGEYRLRSTGEVVTDPDFTTSWIVEGTAR